MVSVEVVNPTKILQPTCMHIFYVHIFQTSSSMKLTFSLKVSSCPLTKVYTYIHCSCYVSCTGCVNQH